MNDDSIMPFGQHKGQKLSDVPDSYCIWLLRQTWVASKHPDLWKYLIDNQDALDYDGDSYDASIEDTY